MQLISATNPLRTVFSVLGAACVVVALAAAVAPRSTGTSDAAKALIQLDDEWSKTAATKDAERMASYYAEDGVAYPPNEPVAVGRAAAKKVWAAYLALPDVSISWKTVHADVASSGDLGFTSGTYQLAFTGPDGKKVSETGKYLCNWKKQKDGSWKSVHDMWNADTK